ncbi:hypothetical protein ABVF02_04980 [Lacticaseibacillus paracasei]|uniref:hypothetical protein n=1 Tax=Lacticaseibacillus paracasei TaxID=1597 RepID=UPI00338DC928
MKKMDEMELKFRDQSIRYAFVFMFTALALYNISQMLISSKLNFGTVVLGITIVIQVGSFEWLKHRADKTDKEPSKVLMGVIILIAVLLTLGVIGLMFHGK